MTEHKSALNGARTQPSRMKRSTLLVLITVATGYFSCGQVSKSTPDTVGNGSLNAATTFHSPNSSTVFDEKYMDTKYVYNDSAGKHLTIHNSLPKGGLKYKDPQGKEWVYAIFWTRIINETASPFELAIEFSPDSLVLQSAPGRYFKLLLPAHTMMPAKEPLFNYGLAELESFLDGIIHQPSSLKRTIEPNESGSFYVVTLFNRGVDGVMRTGLSLKGRDLFYRVNGKEVRCGAVNLQLTELTKSRAATSGSKQ